MGPSGLYNHTKNLVNIFLQVNLYIQTSKIKAEVKDLK